MKAYLISVVLICALVSLASHFLGSTEGARYGRLGLSVVLLWAMVSPLSGLLRALPQIPDFALPPMEEGEEPPLYAARAEEAFCEGIRAAVSEKFSLPEEKISVRTEGFDVKKMRAERICILLKGSAVLADGYAIAAFVEAEGLGDCEVEIEIGSS